MKLSCVENVGQPWLGFIFLVDKLQTIEMTDFNFQRSCAQERRRVKETSIEAAAASIRDKFSGETK